MLENIFQRQVFKGFLQGLRALENETNLNIGIPLKTKNLKKKKERGKEKGFGGEKAQWMKSL